MNDLINDFSDRLYNKQKQIFIHVIGDSGIDESYNVGVSRISPECPNVNVMQSDDDKPSQVLPAMASNVCYQLRNFDVTCRLFSFVDPEAYHTIRDCGIKYWGLVELPKGHNAPRKRRYYANGSQVTSRWDIERSNYGLDSVEYLQKQLLSTWNGFQSEPNVIIFSDYNKGVFTHNFGIENFKTNAITIVDSKSKPLERWKGCTVFKPNAKEAYELTGKKTWKEQCDYLQSKLDCKVVIITQEGNGIVGKIGDYFEYRPHSKVFPVDIVGAGDCFGGILAVAMALGFDAEQAAQIAFYGGSLCVQQKERTNFGPWLFSKIIKDTSFLKNRDYKLVFTNGCFDIIHKSHVDLLRFAKSKGDKLIVALNGDDSIKRLKGQKRPIVNLKDRMKIIAALDCVDYVIGFDDDTPYNLIKEIQPDYIVKGADYRKEDIAGGDIVGLDNIILFTYNPEDSTTSTINKLCQ